MLNREREIRSEEEVRLLARRWYAGEAAPEGLSEDGNEIMIWGSLQEMEWFIDEAEKIEGVQ